ncbi:MAG: DUF4347 domain-containing protein [Nitrospira sp.]|nr:DUF4347 domain-containing protein [Nitrospira sp.]MCW5783460.1 DUF4347 domain-containing protein [Nitrospirales bacterium]
MKLMHSKPATLEAVNAVKVVKRGSQKNRRHTPPQGSPTVRFPGTLPALEERIQFDGAVFAIGAEVVQVTTTADILGIEAETTTDWTYADSSAQGGLRLSGLSFSAPSERKNMEGINPAAEVIFLNSTQDDIEKITKGLTGPKNIGAIHLISHGNQAGLRLGTGHLTVDLMHGTFVAELTIVSDARSGTSNIFTDGCYDGKRAVGRTVAEKFAQLTYADIVASTDLPGSANFGVQWDLELNGVFPYIIGSTGSEQWQGLLTETTFITYESASLEMGEQANEVHLTKPWGQTFLYDSARSIYTFYQNGLVLTSTFPFGSS